MTHALARIVFGSPSILPITESEYDEIMISLDMLYRLYYMEEKFDSLIQNYLEFETELLATTMENILTESTDPVWLLNKRGLLNRRLINLLSAAVAYTEYMEKNVAEKIFNNGDSKCQTLKDMIKDHHFKSFGYKFMYALRNHALHYGFPIHGILYTNDLLETEERNRFRRGIVIYTEVNILKKDGKLEKILKNQEELGDRIDLKPLTRDYVAELADIHDNVIEQLVEKVEGWEHGIESAIKRYTEAFPAEPTYEGLAATVVDGQNRTNAQFLTSKYILNRKLLATKNKGIKRLNTNYATGETIKT